MLRSGEVVVGNVTLHSLHKLRSPRGLLTRSTGKEIKRQAGKGRQPARWSSGSGSGRKARVLTGHGAVVG
ncbi:hypothetical protein DBV39_03920 [Orrella marina]|uniref:Uncharacterized protein n=1 Tax=Orrella marina TaxID=2163011 RepID=A0A2R4XH29_9BURK|nr:hypothetical protein DBV39_03920 [Orrella marina]